MSMPSGDTPQQARSSTTPTCRPPPDRRTAVRRGTSTGSRSPGSGASSLVLALIAALWIWQYRTTRQRTGIYPVDRWGGYTSELAGPATLFFLLFTRSSSAFAVVLIVGHLIWGQKF